MEATIIKKTGQVVGICLPNPDKKYSCQLVNVHSFEYNKLDFKEADFHESKKVKELFTKLGAKHSESNSKL
jgi:hypothetical protein